MKKLERLQTTSQNLLPEEATLYRALSARANYLAQDRPDIAYSTKELCREFAVPTRDSYAKLKRVVRYLLHLPRLVYVYDWQELPTNIDMYTDTDFAGCKSTRRSTSGGIALVGGHCVRHYSTTQSTISLSSGEAELHGIGKGIQHAMGLRSMYADLGYKMTITVHSDATAAIGIARRRGLGKLRHLDCEDLLAKVGLTMREADCPTAILPQTSWFCLGKTYNGKRQCKSVSTSASGNPWQLLTDSCSRCRKGRFCSGKAWLQATSLSQTSPHAAPRMDANATTASREYSRDYVVW